MGSLLGHVRRWANAALKPLGFELSRLDSHHNWADGRTFIAYHATVAAAAAGMSICDYVEEAHNRRGVTTQAIQAMTDIGVFRDRTESVCEIGPGSGRYLERTIQACQPRHYQIYETAADWAEHLVRTYGVTLCPTDGKTLAATPDKSIDLVQAHKVFVTTPTLTTCNYLREMARVVREGGWVVFDILSEDCLDGRTLNDWLAPGTWPDAFPFVMPKAFVVDMLGGLGLRLEGRFFVEMKPGKTECLAFRRSLSH